MLGRNSGGTGYPQPENNPPRTYIAGGDYLIRFGGTGDDFDRTVELEFEIQELMKGKVSIEGQELRLGGWLTVVGFRRRRRSTSETTAPRCVHAAT